MAQVTKGKRVISGIKETLERQRTQMELGASFVDSYGEDVLLDHIEENKLRDAIAQVTQNAYDFLHATRRNSRFSLHAQVNVLLPRESLIAYRVMLCMML